LFDQSAPEIGVDQAAIGAVDGVNQIGGADLGLAGEALEPFGLIDS
jgi:hypothetical protein